MEIEDLATKPKDFKTKGKYVVRTPVDQQRVKLEKLMSNPDKPVVIPMSKQQKNLLAAVPTFVRNVMGSSAGAGSGEFHVYRHLRRKEFARQKQIQYKSRQEELDEEFEKKIEDNRNIAESKTAKKRAKRQKRKQALKNRPPRSKTDEVKESDEDDEQDGSDEEDKDEVEEKRSKLVEDPVEEAVQSEDNKEDETADAPKAVSDERNELVDTKEQSTTDDNEVLKDDTANSKEEATVAEEK